MRRFDVRIAMPLLAAGTMVLSPISGVPQAGALVQPATPNVESPAARADRTHVPDGDSARSESATADWFVDSVRGNDANSGQNIDHPFKTIARLLASPIASGQTIALKAGGHWRETLTVPAANITVTSYGRGRKPLLDASDVVNPGLWSKAPGTANVYQVSVPIDADPNITWVNTW